MSDQKRLSDEQLAFLRFHAQKPAPHNWTWLPANQPPPWTHLRADRIEGRGRRAQIKSAIITREGLTGLEPYWSQPLLTLNELGLAAIEGASVQ
jgi:hypothetical protein